MVGSGLLDNLFFQVRGAAFNTLATTFDMSQITGADTGMLSDVTSKVRDAGNSAIYLVMTIIGIVGVLGLGVAVLKIIFGGASTKSDAKGQLIWILIACIIGFGALAIVGMCKTISENLL